MMMITAIGVVDYLVN